MPSSPRTPRRGPGTRRSRVRSVGEPTTSRNESGRTRYTGRAAVLALVLLVLVISYASSLRAWIDQRQEIAATEAAIAEARARVDQLAQSKQRWHDEAYVRKMARERFGWVLPGEIGYRVIDENGQTVGDTSLDAPEGDAATPDQPDWYDRVWGSIEYAGEPPDLSDKPEQTRPNHTIIRQHKPQRR